MAGRFSVEAVFKAVDRITAPVSRMQNRVGKFTRSMNRGFTRLNRTVDGFSSGVKRAAIASAAALAIVTAAMVGVINTGADFEQTLVNAATKFPGEIRRGTTAFQELEDAARKTGATTEFTAIQSAEALNFLAMAGFSAESAIASLPGVIDLATASSVDLGTAADIATDSLGAFNLLSKDAATNQKNLARISDVLALTTVRANTDMVRLFETLKDAAPVGVAAGQSIESIAAAAGILANAGIKGTRAGAALKNIFTAIAAPASRAGKLMAFLEVETTNAAGGVRDVADVLADFTRATNKLPNAQKLAIFKEIFGKLSLAGAINLANSVDELKGLRTELENATGSVTTMADAMRDTTRGRIKNLTSAIEGVTVTMFKLKQNGIETLLESWTKFTRALDTAIKGNEDFAQSLVSDLIDTFVGAAKIVGVFVLALIVLKTTLLIVNVVLGVLRLTTMVFTAVMFLARVTGLAWAVSLIVTTGAMLALKIAMIAARVTGLAWAVTTLATTGATMAASIATKAWAIAVGLVSAALRISRIALIGWAATMAATAIATKAMALAAPLLAIAMAGLSSVLNFARAAMLAFNLVMFANPIGAVVLAIGLLIGAAALLILNWDKVKDFFVGIWDTISESVVGAIDTMKAKLAEFAAPFQQFFSGIAGLKDKFASLDLFGGDDIDVNGTLDTDGAPGVTPQVVSPQERVARSIEETRSSSKAEIILRAETGTQAEVAEGSLGAGIELQQAGAF